MTKTGGTHGQEGTAGPGAAGAFVPAVDPNDPFGVAGWMRDNMPDVPLHPLMAHPAAAAAAATAVGLGMTGHVAGMMLGVMQGAMETLQKASAERHPREEAPEPVQADAKVDGAKKPAQANQKVVRPALRIVTEPALAAGSDLKLISGIGPKLEQALNRLGITSLADLAGLTPKKVAQLDEQLGLGGRIVRDDWVGQAKGLV